MLKIKFHTTIAFVSVCFVIFIPLIITGCHSTSNSTRAMGSSVGPGYYTNLNKKQYHYPSDIYLDVAIPVFDPGTPKDFDELVEKNIWPQLRRTESTRFAMMTKKALEKTGAFGRIRVVPTPGSTADLYVLGRIHGSNSEDIKLNIQVIDISGHSWGRKTFEHRVSLGYFKDNKHKASNPYKPIFSGIADYIFNLLTSKSEEEKRNIKQITNIRFAQSFSPETFSQYLMTNDKGIQTLASQPSEEDPMFDRIKLLRIQDQLFIDSIQTQYDGFIAKTDDSYHSWQKSTLPNAVAAREAENKAITKGIFGGALLLLGASNAQHTLSKADQITALAGAYFIKESLGEGKEAEAHRDLIDKMGEFLDIKIDPQVIPLEGETLELTGTVEEQYIQWKAHLMRIYALE